MNSTGDIVQHVLTEVITVQDPKPAISLNESHFYLVRAAINQGYREPFSPELTQMNEYLARRLTGQKLAEAAWKIFRSYHRAYDAQT